MHDLAASLGVPVGAIVGEVFDGTEVPLPTVSLVEEFGRDRALGETDAALADAVPLLLERVLG